MKIEDFHSGNLVVRSSTDMTLVSPWFGSSVGLRPTCSVMVVVLFLFVLLAGLVVSEESAFSNYSGNLSGKNTSIITVSESVENVRIEIPNDITVLPDSDFSVVVAISNIGLYSSEIVILAKSEGLGMDERFEFSLEAGFDKELYFVIPATKGVGNYPLMWSVMENGNVIYEKEVSVHVSNTGQVVMDLAVYYGEQIDRLRGKYNEEYIVAADRNLIVAKELAKNNMYFESMKYLDFVRESIEVALSEEAVDQWESEEFFSWGRILFFSGIFVAVVGLGVLVFFGIKKGWFMWFRKLLERRIFKKIKTVFSLEKEDGDKELKLKEKIMGISNDALRGQLLDDFKNCEEKRKVGLMNLSGAYRKKIVERLREEFGEVGIEEVEKEIAEEVVEVKSEERQEPKKEKGLGVEKGVEKEKPAEEKKEGVRDKK